MTEDYLIYEEESVKATIVYDQSLAYEPFGIGFFIKEVKVEIQEELPGFHQLLHEAELALRKCPGLTFQSYDDIQLQFTGEVTGEVTCDYPHEIEEMIAPIAHAIHQAFKDLPLTYRTQITLEFFNE